MHVFPIPMLYYFCYLCLYIFNPKACIGPLSGPKIEYTMITWARNCVVTHHYISSKMAQLVKLAIISKTGEEASLLRKKLACLSSSLHSSGKTAISHVY